MHKLCHINEIDEDSSKGFEVDGHSVFAVKKDGVLHVYKNHCPHLGIELNWMPDQFLDSESVLIECSTHGALFEIQSGLCISGPCVNQSLIPISFEIKDQLLWVQLPALD